MLVNKIINYLQQCQKNKRAASEEQLLLGCYKQKVADFITFQELDENPNQALEKTCKLLQDTHGTLIINGNLRELFILKFIKLAQKEKWRFSIVVNDGYKLSEAEPEQNFDALAVIVKED